MREAQLTLARTRVTQFEWTLGDSLRLVKIPIVEDNRSRASAATAQILGLPENIFRQPFLLPRWGRVRFIMSTGELLTVGYGIVHLLHRCSRRPSRAPSWRLSNCL